MICTRPEIHGQVCPEDSESCPIDCDGFVCMWQVHYIKPSFHKEEMEAKQK
jgi:hypothetical protein